MHFSSSSAKEFSAENLFKISTKRCRGGGIYLFKITDTDISYQRVERGLCNFELRLSRRHEVCDALIPWVATRLCLAKQRVGKELRRASGIGKRLLEN